ncbi:hypothetical protein H101_08057 [Trichophyton interdigitale H6]|nr:hypothetical protein H101_08057 [Trichophyton interdigitale H6]
MPALHVRHHIQAVGFGPSTVSFPFALKMGIYRPVRPNINPALPPKPGSHLVSLVVNYSQDNGNGPQTLSQHQQQQTLYCKNPTLWNVGGKEVGSEMINAFG